LSGLAKALYYDAHQRGCARADILAKDGFYPLLSLFLRVLDELRNLLVAALGVEYLLDVQDKLPLQLSQYGAAIVNHVVTKLLFFDETI
jgi:hypothetical protein